MSKYSQRSTKFNNFIKYAMKTKKIIFYSQIFLINIKQPMRYMNLNSRKIGEWIVLLLPAEANLSLKLPEKYIFI